LTGNAGACKNIVLLNAALAILAGEMAITIKEGIEIAQECIDNGAAIKKLQALIELSNS
jgi:anthranilate phosphoribosyltransferase